MNAAAQLEKAIASENSGDLAGAMVLYEKVVRREPGNTDALFLLGRARCMQGQLEAGADAFRKVVRLRPDHLQAHTLLGMALVRLGKAEDALASLDRALAGDPRLELALAGRADALASLGRHAEAVAGYDKALAVNPANVATWCNRGNALQALGRTSEAVESFRRAVALNPGLAEAHFNLANALHKLDRNEEAVSHYRRAIALRPGMPASYVNLGRALLALNRWEEAAQVSEQALRLDPASVLGHAHLGAALYELGRYDVSLVHLDKALELDPNCSVALREKGRILSIQGRMEDARAVLERAIEIDPREPKHYIILGHLKRFKADDPFIPVMEDFLSAPALAEVTRIELHFVLGKVYRDIGQHVASFDHLLKANRLARRQIEYDEAYTLELFERIKRVFTPELLAAKSGSGDPSDQPIFIVGMPRSGTTLIEQILASHPRVHAAGERKDLSTALASVIGDTRLFPDIVPDMTPEQLKDIGSGYMASMTKSIAGMVRFTDKLPGNFARAGLVRLALPNARIIHARRNPVDTCLSCFSLRFGEPMPFAYDLGELGRFYRAYESLMEHWRQVLPADAMLEVQYEDVVADLETQARRIVAYCGLEWDDACLAFHKTERPVLTASLAQVRRPIYKDSVERWRPYEKHLGPLLEALGHPV